MTKDSKAVALDYLEKGWSQANENALSSIVAFDSVYHNGLPQTASGLDRYKQDVKAIRTVFPDLQLNTENAEDQIVEDDQVVTRWTARGTHQGEFMGMASTGKQVTIRGIQISRIADGKVIESWNEVDVIDLMHQLSGANPTNREENVNQRIERILKELTPSVKAKLSLEAQEELAQLINTLTYIAADKKVNIRQLKNEQRPQLVEAIEVAISALLAERSNISLARLIRVDVQGQLGKRSPVGSAINAMRRSPAATVVISLGTFLYLMIVVLPLLLIFLPTKLFAGVDYAGLLGVDHIVMILLISLAGALGSLVSIMLKVQTFTYDRRRDPVALFFFVFFKPIVGASFALFAFALISSGLQGTVVVPVQGKENLFFLALAFIAGFSERFVPDIMSTAQSRIVNGVEQAKDDEPSGQQSSTASDGQQAR